MDASRNWLCALDRQRRGIARPNARRGDHRCGEIRAPGRGSRHCDDRMQRAGLRGMADLSGDCGRRCAACGCQLRFGSGDRRDQPRSGWASRDQRAIGTQCALCFARQRRGRGLDGDLRLSVVEPFGVPRCLLSRDPYLAGAGEHPRAGNRRRPRPRLRVADGAGRQVDQRPGFAAPASSACVCRQYPAASTGQRRDVAADGGHRHHAIKQVGARPDRSLHHRSAGHRRADVALGRAQGASMGQAAAAFDGLCGARGPRPAVCHSP